MNDKPGWFGRLREGLKRTSSRLGQGINDLLVKRKLDDETLTALEELLISADLGVTASAKIIGTLRATRFGKEASAEEIKESLAEEIATILAPVAVTFTPDTAKKPMVILVIGVNGTGKTTTIGKLAKYFREQGHSLTLAAGDTFRAAAVQQLTLWGQRAGCPVVSGAANADAAGLAFDALQQAQERGDNLLLIDTAGRLHNKADLMAELQKMVRVIKKRDESAPHEVLLVLDATTGQNALRQVEIFKEMVGVTGLVLTKLDGTAKGGVLVGLAEKFGVPVRFIGVGEGADDLRPFDAQSFARGLLGLD